MTRKSLSKKDRFFIFERDGFCCQYCGKDPINFDIVLEVDHCISVKDGGDNSKDNLVTSCFDCNRGKGRKNTILGKHPSENEEKEKLERAKQRLRQIKVIKKIRIERKAILEDIEREKFGFIEEKLGGYTDYLISKMNMAIKGKYNKGEDICILEESLDITLNYFYDFEEFYTDDFVKYFYGVLRNRSFLS